MVLFIVPVNRIPLRHARVEEFVQLRRRLLDTEPLHTLERPATVLIQDLAIFPLQSLTHLASYWFVGHRLQMPARAKVFQTIFQPQPDPAETANPSSNRRFILLGDICKTRLAHIENYAQAASLLYTLGEMLVEAPPMTEQTKLLREIMGVVKTRAQHHRVSLENHCASHGCKRRWLVNSPVPPEAPLHHSHP